MTTTDTDRKTPFAIVICSNAETLEDGYRNEYGEAPDGLTEAMTDAAVRVIRRHPKWERVAWTYDRTYRNWHGGIHKKAGAVISGNRYGHCGGLIVTHEIDPPQWLCDLIDNAAEAMTEAADTFEN